MRSSPGKIPIVSSTDPRTIFTFLWTLGSLDYLYWPDTTNQFGPGVEQIIRNLTSLQLFYSLVGKSTKNLPTAYLKFEVAFVYYGLPLTDSYAKKKLTDEQVNPLIESLDEDEKRSLWIVRADNPISGDSSNPPPCSIRESITNLIATLYYTLRGYAILSDIGSGVDLIPFKIKETSVLQEKSIFDSGLIEQLRLTKAFGSPVSKEIVIRDSNQPEEEILAVETESWKPSSGISQLKGGFVDWWFSRHGYPAKPFDRAVLACPCFNNTLEDIDVLTYDENGIRLNRSSKENYATGVRDHDREQGLNYFRRSIKRELSQYVKIGSAFREADLASLPLFQLDDSMAKFIDGVSLERLVQLFNAEKEA